MWLLGMVPALQAPARVIFTTGVPDPIRGLDTTIPHALSRNAHSITPAGATATATVDARSTGRKVTGGTHTRAARFLNGETELW